MRFFSQENLGSPPATGLEKGSSNEAFCGTSPRCHGAGAGGCPIRLTNRKAEMPNVFGTFVYSKVPTQTLAYLPGYKWASKFSSGTLIGPTYGSVPLVHWMSSTQLSVPKRLWLGLGYVGLGIRNYPQFYGDFFHKPWNKDPYNNNRDSMGKFFFCVTQVVFVEQGGETCFFQSMKCCYVFCLSSQFLTTNLRIRSFDIPFKGCMLFFFTKTITPLTPLSH